MNLWKSVAQDLEEKTKAFWRVSSVWNSRSSEEILTGEAIVICTDNLKYSNIHRPIVRFTNKLLGELIQGEGSPAPEKTSLITFPDILDSFAAEKIQ